MRAGVLVSETTGKGAQASLFSEVRWRTLADPRPFPFALEHVVPSQGHAVQPPRELRLKNHQVAIAEPAFARREVKFPHAAKSLIVNAAFVAVAR
jgi:hypothetical protein